jgi:hypothetical protein
MTKKPNKIGLFDESFKKAIEYFMRFWNLSDGMATAYYPFTVL